MTTDDGTLTTFDTGATRDTSNGKLDYEGFLSPRAVKRYAEYMHGHRVQSDGTMRDSDNWQKGMPRESFMKSGFRHFFDWWSEHRGQGSRDGIEDALCALIFNAFGYLDAVLKEKEELRARAAAIVEAYEETGDACNAGLCLDPLYAHKHNGKPCDEPTCEAAPWREAQRRETEERKRAVERVRARLEPVRPEGPINLKPSAPLVMHNWRHPRAGQWTSS